MRLKLSFSKAYHPRRVALGYEQDRTDPTRCEKGAKIKSAAIVSTVGELVYQFGKIKIRKRALKRIT